MTKEEAQKLLDAADVFYDCDPDDPEDEPNVLNQNDTWGWALAMGEKVPDECLIEVANLFRQYGDAGILYWVSKRNDNMRSQFNDVNRKIDFVEHEIEIRKKCNTSSKLAFYKTSYTIGEKPSLFEKIKTFLKLVK